MKKIFMLEDNPDVFPSIEKLRRLGHTVTVTSNLKDAAYKLECNPGVDYYDKFMFDAALISENVPHLKKKKEFVYYNEPNGFNGLLFLLNNLDTLGENAFRPERVAIITALTNKLIHIPKIVMPNGKRSFESSELPKADSKLMIFNKRVPKIRYTDNKRNIYTFSYIDKTTSDVLALIRTFIGRG